MNKYEKLRIGTVELGDYVRVRWGDEPKNEVTGLVTTATSNSVRIIDADQKMHSFFYQDDTEVLVKAKANEYDFI